MVSAARTAARTSVAATAVASVALWAAALWLRRSAPTPVTERTPLAASTRA